MLARKRGPRPQFSPEAGNTLPATRQQRRNQRRHPHPHPGAVGATQKQPNTNPMGRRHSTTGQHEATARRSSVCLHPQSLVLRSATWFVGTLPWFFGALPDSWKYHYSVVLWNASWFIGAQLMQRTATHCHFGPWILARVNWFSRALQFFSALRFRWATI